MISGILVEVDIDKVVESVEAEIKDVMNEASELVEDGEIEAAAKITKSFGEISKKFLKVVYLSNQSIGDLLAIARKAGASELDISRLARNDTTGQLN